MIKRSKNGYKIAATTIKKPQSSATEKFSLWCSRFCLRIVMQVLRDSCIAKVKKSSVSLSISFDRVFNNELQRTELKIALWCNK
ncbi:unnamed protein product [Wuchereria bancrofti]|uniref:Uncharacterized protein n=1 Tax=Wuchereria bancrofti TaxID=6293 RepID=A0A3P7DGS1_WUCBA|nr:unnamed protein product [Wuchereria bancrofti]